MGSRASIQSISFVSAKSARTGSEVALTVRIGRPWAKRGASCAASSRLWRPGRTRLFGWVTMRTRSNWATSPWAIRVGTGDRASASDCFAVRLDPVAGVPLIDEQRRLLAQDRLEQTFGNRLGDAKQRA